MFLRSGLAVCVLLLAACKEPGGGEMTDGTGGESTTTGVTTVNLTSTTDPTSGTGTGVGSTGTTEVGTGTTSGTTTTSGASTGEITASTGASTGGGGACTPTACDGVVLACGDCVDNDGDGKIDQADPECITPCDDREDTFATGLPGDNMDPCNQDCFFDGNSGAGDDKCNWNLKCDPLSPGGDVCPYDPGYKNCPEMQDQTCVDSCQVPNGCDCFGCCTVVVDGVAHDVFLGDMDCSVQNIDNCEQCTKNADCDEDCQPEMCEVCFGETEPPPGCEEPTCMDGQQGCTVDDMGQSDCPEGFFCSAGCCFEIQPG